MGERDERPKWHANEGCEEHGGQAHDQSQAHNGDERGVAGKHELERGDIARHVEILFPYILCRWYDYGQIA